MPVNGDAPPKLSGGASLVWPCFRRWVTYDLSSTTSAPHSAHFTIILLPIANSSWFLLASSVDADVCFYSNKLNASLSVPTSPSSPLRYLSVVASAWWPIAI
jgi:hypothetical protein